jgi:putative lipoic acid-binding regulatory protein
MTKETLIDFPCRFPIKIIAINSPLFIDVVMAKTTQHFSGFTANDLVHQLSGKNKYIAITVTVFAEHKEQLDAFYHEITKLEHVKMVL